MGQINTEKYIIYSIKNYSDGNKQFIEENGNIFYDIKNIITELKTDNYYHFRIHKYENYIFFGDLDNLNIDIDDFIKLLIDFMLKSYNLNLNYEDVKYTQNNIKNNSYHYSIPKWNCSTEKLKEIHLNLLKENNTLKKYIDTTIYSEHWFRCPNQSKGSIKLNESQNKHVIINGKIKNFIINYIPKSSVNIENYEYNNNNLQLDKNIDIDNNEEKNYDNKKIICKENNTEIIKSNDDLPLSKYLSNLTLYKKIFDECFKPDRFEKYEYWINIGMVIKNTFTDINEALELFNYYSSKGKNYEGYEKTKYKFLSFEKKDKNGLTIKTIYFYAIEDNKPKFVEIMNKNTFELEETDMCKYLKLLVGHKFLYIVKKNNYKLYCYNEKYWQTDDIILRDCISTVLYDFLKMLLTEIYWNTKDFYFYKTKIDRLKKIQMKKNIIETYKECGVRNDINFDDKWWLFAFNNLVYDMKDGTFREHKYDDYISMTCGYDWREPTKEEINTVNELINKIMPIEEERESFLQILSTGIDGRCLEKFIIFNGNGRNGKGLIDDLFLLLLGDYGMIGNNSILFENSKTGSNPEKANIHKKRYVVFREPPERQKFENSIIKELTGGGLFSARGHHESDTEKELNLTMIVECNKKPLFSEEPKESEIQRIIDIYFRSTFVTDTEKVDPDNYIFLANQEYKTKEFQHKHKFALFHILISEHKKYLNNNSTLKLSKSIVERTYTYLELSCNILQWFKENFKYTKNKKDFLKLKDIYSMFCDSGYYSNLTKLEKRKYNKSFFIEHFQTNIFLCKYYQDRYNNYSNVIKEWVIKNEED
jgi:phage/plasmid-associated DNA primase